MQAWLVVNEFLRGEKFQSLEGLLTRAAKKNGIKLLTKTNARIMINFKEPFIWKSDDRPDFILFWDKDVRLARYLEETGVRVFNSAQAIAVCDDKALTHMALHRYGMPMPNTMIAPMTYPNVGYTNVGFLDCVEEQLPYPIIVKECFGSFGWQVYRVRNRKEMKDKLRELAGKPLLFQEYVKTSFARDVRLQVVGNEVIAAMYRYSETGDFRANVTNGGRMKPYEPTKEQCEIAVRCCRILGLDFAGVDLLFGEGDETLVCEVNSNAHIQNILDCTGINAADAIMEHIRNVLG